MVEAAASTVEFDRPGFDGVDHEVGITPRIPSERGPYDIVCLGLVGQRTAKDDETVVHEPIHEGSMGPPTGLLLQAP
jgi:hypothetical protein